MISRVPKSLLSHLILLQMEENPTYGYEIIENLKKLSNNNWDPSYGTVYGALNRLKRDGFIKRAEKDHEDRKYFTLTEKGKEKLEEGKNEMEDVGIGSQERILGFLNIYKEVHGEDDFKNLLNKIQEEFDEFFS